MALPPTIPTSFVPHSSISSEQRARPEYAGIFGVVAYIILAVVIALAAGVFLYSRALVSEQEKTSALLTEAEAKIDSKTVEGFVEMRDRLNFSSQLLDQHTAVSNFFTLLEQMLPVPARFSSVSLSIDSTGAVKINGSGVAKNFNALAAVSAAFAANERINDAIFSKISVNKDKTVSFDVAATLDPSVITYRVEETSENVTTSLPLTNAGSASTTKSAVPAQQGTASTTKQL